MTNDLHDLNNGRVDNLAALITVAGDQMNDSATPDATHRISELSDRVFGDGRPSVENYLATRDTPPMAA